MRGVILKSLLILVAILSIGAGFGYWQVTNMFNRYRGLPMVLAVPPGALDPVFIEPYAGPHPRLMARPEETFPFPLQVGDRGPVTPLFAGAPRYPMLCRTVDSALGQPVVDNQDGHGMAVYSEDGENLIGYSRDCELQTRIHYWYRSRESETFQPYDDSAVDEVDSIELDGRRLPFVVRIETGTINRHIYLIAVLAGPEDRPETPDLSHWNDRLIYYFRGGVGIGHRQGRTAISSILRRRGDEIARGYAVAYSSANQTSNTYDILLSEDTALRVKRQFEAGYGKPAFTIGVGGSGGAIQQYLLGQNRPGLLDGAIALYSYPDMVTQSIHILDCELLAHYFDVTDRGNRRWSRADERSAIVGMNGSDELSSRFSGIQWLAELARGDWPEFDRGITECLRSWRGMTPLVLNPHYSHFSTRFEPQLSSAIEWTLWSDMRQTFGTDPRGHARRTWDNVGVQYGLEALREGRITALEFIDLNRRVGGWRPTHEMQPTRFWVADAGPSSLTDYSPNDAHNITAPDIDGYRARTSGDPRAISAGWQSGQVFTGVIDIPVIDLRHYMESDLDMHHASATFSTRERILSAMGDAGHQVIWMTHPSQQPWAQAFDAMDRWLSAIKTHPQRSLVGNRPEDVSHGCWDETGRTIAAGETVWDGAWNDKEVGECMRHYPIYGTSRTRAGGSLRGDRFQCHRQNVGQAIEQGVYHPVEMGAWQDELEGAFPDGVCDLTRPGPGIPDGMVDQLMATVPSGRVPSGQRSAVESEGESLR